MRIFRTTFKTSTILALLFFTIAAYHLFATLLFLRVAIPTVAIVQGFRSQPVTYNVDSAYGSRRDTYFSNIPIIKFHAANGSEYELLKHIPFSFYEKGQTIDILYDPNNPENSRQQSITAIWGICILFSFLSFAILFYRLSIVVKKHRNQHRRREGR